MAHALAAETAFAQALASSIITLALEPIVLKDASSLSAHADRLGLILFVAISEAVSQTGFVAAATAATMGAFHAQKHYRDNL